MILEANIREESPQQRPELEFKTLNLKKSNMAAPSQTHVTGEIVSFHQQKCSARLHTDSRAVAVPMK